ILGNPDDLAVLAIHLRLEAAHRAVRVDRGDELRATAGLDVDLAQIAARANEIERRIEAEDARQRRVRIEKLPAQRRAEDAFERVLEQVVVAALRFSQRAVRALASGDVLHDAFDRDQATVGIENPAAALPYPTRFAVRMDDAILAVEPTARTQRGADLFAHAAPILRVRQRFIRQTAVEQQIVGVVPGQAATTFADELHGPSIVVATAIDHAVQIAEQRAQ